MYIKESGKAGAVCGCKKFREISDIVLGLFESCNYREDINKRKSRFKKNHYNNNYKLIVYCKLHVEYCCGEHHP